MLDVDYSFTVFAVMNLFTVKGILALSATSSLPVQHGDTPNAYVKTYKKKYLVIYLNIPSGMSVNEETA